MEILFFRNDSPGQGALTYANLGINSQGELVKTITDRNHMAHGSAFRKTKGWVPKKRQTTSGLWVVEEDRIGYNRPASQPLEEGDNVTFFDISSRGNIKYLISKDSITAIETLLGYKLKEETGFALAELVFKHERVPEILVGKRTFLHYSNGSIMVIDIIDIKEVKK